MANGEIPESLRPDVGEAINGELARLGHQDTGAELGGQEEGLTAAVAAPAKVWRWSRRGLLFDVDEI